LPGLKVVIPSTAHDAKGLMISAIRDENPVVFMFHKNLQGMGWLGTVQGAITDVPEADYETPLGLARVARPGRDVTVVGLGATVHQALDAASDLADRGVEVEVLDLRSLVPLDRDAILSSVRRTGRLVVVDDDYMSYGLSGEIIATVVERDVSCLKAAPVRVAHPDVPIPFARPMEQFALPNAEKVIAAVEKTLGKAT
ncbi:MAG: transketolase C-terminal domain-containing protein, partial [Pseudomonadota bacterium]